MKYVGIDIGSTVSKVVVRGEKEYYFASRLSEKLERKVEPTEQGRYAGALVASYLAEEKV